MRHALVVVDGVLRDVVTGQPDELGRELYQALATVYRITLIADRQKKDLLDKWLFREGFDKHLAIDFNRYDDRLTQIRMIRASQVVDLVVVPETDLVHDLYDMGVPVLVFVHPKHFGQATRVPNWGELTKRIEEDRLRRRRLLREEIDGY